MLFVLAAAQLHGPRTNRRFAAPCWDEGLCALLAALGSGLFFGGSFVAPTAGTLELAFGGVVAALKGLGCYALLRVVDGSVLLTTRNWLWVILIGVTPLWVRLAPSRSFELIWGSVVCVVCVCIALAGLVSVRSTRARTTPAEPSQPTAATARAKAEAKPATRRRAARTASAEPGVIAAPRAARLR
jgi:hypothetical protein